MEWSFEQDFESYPVCCALCGGPHHTKFCNYPTVPPINDYSYSSSPSYYNFYSPSHDHNSYSHSPAYDYGSSMMASMKEELEKNMGMMAHMLESGRRFHEGRERAMDQHDAEDATHVPPPIQPDVVQEELEMIADNQYGFEVYANMPACCSSIWLNNLEWGEEELEPPFEDTSMEEVAKIKEDESESEDYEEPPFVSYMTESDSDLEEPNQDMPNISEVGEDHDLSSEDEFGDELEEFGEELVNLPTLDNGEFDTLGDRKIPEDLLFKEPSVGIKEELPKKSYGDVEKSRHEPYSISSRNVSRIYDVTDDSDFEAQRYGDHEGKLSLSRPRHHAISFLWGDRFPDYMIIIQFGPGKFKYWWVDLSLCLCAYLRIAVGYIPANCERRILRSVDGKRIKEKPPD